MSFVAENFINQKKAEKDYYDSLGREPEPAAAPAAAAAPAEPDPRSFTYEAPAGAEDPNTAVGRERQRFAAGGVGQNETYRLLGGPRQRLGA